MYRRRRPPRQSEHFSFDSFLDVVANVIGVIVRLILVTWVGARSYTSAMQYAPSAPLAVPPAPQLRDDPLSPELERARRELAETQARLHEHLEKLGLVLGQSQQTEQYLMAIVGQKRDLDTKAAHLSTQLKEHGTTVRQVALSLDELRDQSKRLLEQVKILQAQPAEKRALRYHAPVSREAVGDEMMFECRDGRVTFIDLPTFLQEARADLERCGNELKTQYSVSHTTASAGAFRLRYTVERERDAYAEGGGRPTGSGFRYGLAGWEVEPVTAGRGEALSAVFAPQSEFRQLTDRLDPRLTTVTIWVYPDPASFDLFRRLRDHLYERGLEVAGRPLPTAQASIAASRHGSASRAQ